MFRARTLGHQGLLARLGGIFDSGGTWRHMAASTGAQITNWGLSAKMNDTRDRASHAAADLDRSPVGNFLNALRLDGKVFVVLGAGQFIGRRTAHALAQAGAHVVCVGRRAEPTEHVAREVNGTAIVADALKRNDMERLFGEAMSRFGGIHGVADILGVAVRTKLMDLSDDQWREQMDVLLLHALLTVQVGGPAIAASGGGAITFVGSIAGDVVIMDRTAPGYGIGKAALNQLTRASAYELGPQGIRVNLVSPGLIRTPRYDIPDEAWWQATRERYPLRRVGDMDDVAAAILFLSSGLAANVTGQLLRVDGGLTIQSPAPYAPLA